MGNFQREWMFTAVLMASLPPALNVFVLANQYHVYVERASTAILIGTLASVGTVTALLLLVAHDSIPFDLFP
jgi:predicted permease